MKALLRTLPLLASAIFVSACGQSEVSFADDISPVFQKRCVSCHSGSGEGATTSEFLVVDYDTVMHGTTHGPVVFAGSRMSSTLYLVVAGRTAPEIRMPPHNDESFAQGRGEMLSAQTIEMIGTWIDQGARNN